MITEQQVYFFKTFGFLVLKNVLTPDEIKKINEEFAVGLAKMDETKMGASVRKQYNWTNLGPDSPFTASLLEDERFYGIAQQILGDDCVGVDSHANQYNGNRSPWHPDIREPGPDQFSGFKFTFYLAPVDGNSGALRVVPGSHRPGFSAEVEKVYLKDNNPGPDDDPGLAVNEVPAHICVSEPGDAVIFDYYSWHSSWGGSKDRRMVSLQYYKNPKTPEEEEGMRQMVAFRKNFNKGFKRETKLYPDFWLSNPHNNAIRSQWIEWFQKWGFIDAVKA